MKKIAIFVDVQNIYYTTRQAFARQFNYRKFWQSISEQGEIVEATAYAIARADDQQIKFQDALRHIGFNIKLKRYIQRSDGSAKGDWDVGITIDILAVINQVDEIVLLSGDGDFDLLIQKVESCGVQSKVYGVAQLTAKSLIDATSQFVAIDESLLI